MNWKEEYLKYLGAVDAKELDIQRAQSIKIKNLPSQLYKYRNITDNSLQNLIEDSVFLNRPSAYNDPYEFYENIDITPLLRALTHTRFDEILSSFSNQVSLDKNIVEEAKTKEDPFSFIGEHILKQHGYSDNSIAEVLKILDQKVVSSIEHNISNRLKLMQNSMRVCSFCESPNELLMWSHYADAHRGFCVEYNIQSWKPGDTRNNLLFPVTYEKDFYDSTEHLLAYIQQNEFNNLYPIIAGSTKSIDWEYEKEWRFIIQVGESSSPQNYYMNCQTKLFLGANISPENRSKILEISRQKNIEVFQSSISKSRYSLEFRSINLNSLPG